MQKIITVGQTSNKGSQAGKVYSVDGIFPIVCACTHGYAIGNILVVEEMQKIITVGNYSPSNHNASRIVSANGLAPTVMENHGTVTAVALMEEDVYLSNGAIRGRYNEKGKIEQKLELRNDGVTNTLTTVEKDNVIVEGKDMEINTNKLDPSGVTICEQRCDEGIRFFKDNICGSLRTIDSCGDKRIIENNKLKGGENMWKNELEKFEFDMDTLRVFDTFSGKGALHKSLTKLGVPLNIVGLSEVEPDAIIAYAAIHIDNFKDLEFEYPSDEQIKEELMDKNVGWDFIKQKSSILRMKKDKLKLLYKANVLLNNLGDISKLDYDNIPDFDLMNFSFPCTDLSLSGKQKGFINEDGTHTRSGLVKFGLDVIKAKTPKYIMIENVKGLISGKFINDFHSIINEVESLGYKCYYPEKEVKKALVPTCINAKNFGIPQSRDRIFVFAIRKDVDNGMEFNYGFDNGVRLKHLLEKVVDEKYYINKANNINMKENYLQYDNSGKGYESQAARLYYTDSNMGSLPFRNNGDKSQIIESERKQLDEMGVNGKNYNEVKGNLKIRKLTPLECFRLMGFDDEDFYKVKECGLSDSSLYKLAGNSIVVNCLYFQFKNLFKNYIVGNKND